MREKALRIIPVTLLLLFFFSIAPQASAQVTLYSTFGPSLGFNPFGGPGFGPNWVAVPFTPSGPAYLSQIDLALEFHGFPMPFFTNQAEIQICADNAGEPGSVLESWFITNLPVNPPPLTTVVATQIPQAKVRSLSPSTQTTCRHG